MAWEFSTIAINKHAWKSMLILKRKSKCVKLMISLGKRVVQKLRTSKIVTLPALWVRQFEPDKIGKIEFFMDENKNLILKASPIDTPKE
jgi:hypothetical protein